MKCHKIQNLLSLYVSEDLPTTTIEKVRTHLEQCSACTAECESLKESVSALRESAFSLSEADILQEGAWERLSPVIQRAKRPRHNPVTMPWWQLSYVQPIGAAAAIVLLIVGLFAYSQNRTPSVTNNLTGETLHVENVARVTRGDSTPSTGVVPVSLPSSFADKDVNIGIQTKDLPTEIGMQWGAPDGIGVMVVGVELYSPADHAQMEPGDIIISLDGISVTDEETLQLLLNAHDSRDTIVLEIVRDGRRIIQKLLPDSRPSYQPFHHYRKDTALDRLVKTNNIINQLIDYEEQYYKQMDR